MAHITIDQQRCKGCLLCVGVCPKGLLRKHETLNKKGVNPVVSSGQEACSGCCLCAIICPECCIEVYTESP